MSGYRVVVEDTGDGFSAFSPDLPGCIATGPTEEETRARMAFAIRQHVQGLEKSGRPVPPPPSE